MKSFTCLIFLLGLLSACSRAPSTVRTAFYYWKSSFELSAAQDSLLHTEGGNRLYLHMFDVAWDAQTKRSYPDAVTRFRTPVRGLQVTPVIFIRNKVFEQLSAAATDSLARQVLTFLGRIAAAQQFRYAHLQFDCDWTLGTRDRYFRFLRAVKILDKHPLEATIRLHQVKYRTQTGVPPVDLGVLMFYNMGKISADVNSPNSIYNETDADKYLASLNSYPLPLDAALPAFGWSVHSRAGKVTGLPVRIDSRVLQDTQHFVAAGKGFRAKNSFFLSGIYIRQNDIFKPESVSPELLDQAARQLGAHLKQRRGRHIIYYELANLDTTLYQTAALRGATARF